MARVYLIAEKEMRELLTIGKKLATRAADAEPVTRVAGERFVHAECLNELRDYAQLLLDHWAQSVGYEAPKHG